MIDPNKTIALTRQINAAALRLGLVVIIPQMYVVDTETRAATTAQIVPPGTEVQKQIDDALDRAMQEFIDDKPKDIMKDG